MGQLVGAGQLAVYLQHKIRPDSEELAIRVAEGWLASVVPAATMALHPTPADLWSWAVELAALAYSNPQNLVSRTDDQETRGWQTTSRRREILDAATLKYGSAAGGGAPASIAYSFPDSAPWPDPALVVTPAVEVR